jgi:predicted amidohydrolase YtcJ
MAMAGVDASTKDPPGGEILRDEQGRPIGVFRETAQSLVSRARRSSSVRRTPAERDAALRKTIRLADRECLSKGVTSFQDAGSPFSTIDVLRDMAQDGDLGTRLWVMIRESNARLKRLLIDYELRRIGRDHLTVMAIKRTIDGALGSRGAWLLEPYADAPDSTGLNTATVEDVRETARLAAEYGFQLCVHAIGDRANREVLDIFEQTFAQYPNKKDWRWRIEHAQHLSAADIPRFGQLGVIASMQGVHCTSDAPYVTPRLGAARAEEGAYVWQKLLKSGAVVTNGTDAPVEDVDPIASYYATVSRRTSDRSVFYPEQRMSRMEALKSYTISAAWAAFEDDIKGSLRPGKLADVVVLSQNITTVPEEQIPDTEVLYTIVGGEVLYQKPEAR